MIDTFLILKLLITFIASLVFIRVLIRYAPALGLVDIPNHRSSHRHVTPRGAGIGMIGGLILADMLTLNDLVFSHLPTFLAMFLVFIVGVLDDHRDAAPKTKFFVIFAAVLLLAMDGIVIESAGTFFEYELRLGWFAIPFTMFAVAGFTNALNLVDGLDGLAASLSIVILAALGMIGYTHGDLFIVSVSLSMIAALCAFLVFNWNPARIFMGDSGSLVLGFTISVLSIKALPYIQPSAILFIAAIPILDTLIVMIRRKRSGKSIFSPDKLHMHHILLTFFSGNVRKTVVFIVLVQILYTIMGLDMGDYHFQRYILLLFALNLMILYMLLNGMLARQNKFAFYRTRKRRKKEKRIDQ